ncbi:MAG: hypothetical protein ACRBN8_31690 [Nannocystales bacterium]
MKIDRFAPRPRLAASLRLAACLTVIPALTMLGPIHAATAAPLPMVVTPPAAAEPGDLSAQADAAVAAREADPTPAAWRAEAQAKEAMGDLRGAEAAYAGERDALPEDDIDARRKAEVDWERMREQSRGAVEDEPRSTHRAELDGQWVAPASPEELRPVSRPKADPTLDNTPRSERIVTKWYFWVTVAAIAASAGAVAGIAIKAARDERSDSLDASALQPMPMSPGGFRF